MNPVVDLVFDLDGTLSDPAQGILRCINYALTHFGYAPVAEDQITHYIGPPLDETFVTLTSTSSADHVAGLVEKYRERYGARGYCENVIYPGIPEALDALASRNTTMGVCTSKRADFAERILDHFHIRDHFCFVDGGDVGRRKEQQLASLLASGAISSSSCLIGDRAVDVRAAQANGIRAIAVLWGHGSLGELQAAAPDLILESPHELIQLVTSGNL